MFGYKIEYENGSSSVSGCATASEAIVKCIGVCKLSGWRLARFYEFWRWGERNPYKDLDNALEYEAKEKMREYNDPRP